MPNIHEMQTEMDKLERQYEALYWSLLDKEKEIKELKRHIKKLEKRKYVAT